MVQKSATKPQPITKRLAKSCADRFETPGEKPRGHGVESGMSPESHQGIWRAVKDAGDIELFS